MAAVYFSGFSGTSSGAFPGVHQMITDSTIGGRIPGPQAQYTYSDVNNAVRFIEHALQQDPSQPVVLIGHSFGGDAAIETAKKLAVKEIYVDLMVQIESVGVGDEDKPDNVVQGVNIWSISRQGLNGAKQVRGSDNIGVDGTTHTGIDEAAQTREIVARYIGRIQMPSRNATR